MFYIEAYAKEHIYFSFRNLLEEQHSKMDTIVTFLGILEFMRMGILKIEQKTIFEDILITYTGKSWKNSEIQEELF